MVEIHKIPEHFISLTFTIFLFQRRALFTWSKICFYFSISLMLDHALLDVLTNSCNLVLSMKMLSLEKSFHLLHLKNNNQKAIQTSDSYERKYLLYIIRMKWRMYKGDFLILNISFVRTIVCQQREFYVNSLRIIKHM